MRHIFYSTSEDRIIRNRSINTAPVTQNSEPLYRDSDRQGDNEDTQWQEEAMDKKYVNQILHQKTW